MNTPANRPVNPNQTLVIFDCDGVLVDTEVLAVELDRQILSEHGWNLTREQVIEKFLGTPMITVQRELERYLGYSLGEGWIDTLTHRYQREFDQRLTAVADIEHALNAIDSAGFRTCVASSGSRQKIEHSLTLCGLYERFSGRIFSADDVARGKPPRTSLSTPQHRWATPPPTASSSKTAPTASPQPAPPTCPCSATPAVSLPNSN